MIELNSFLTVYSYYKVDNKITIPAMFRWGTYKPWLIFGANEALVEGDSNSFSMLYHNASDIQKGKRYEVTDRDIQNNDFEFFTVSHDGEKHSAQKIVDSFYGVSMEQLFIKTQSALEANSWIATVQVAKNQGAGTLFGSLSMVFMFKIETFDIGSRDTWLNVSDASSNQSITIQILNQSNPDAFNGYQLNVSEGMRIKYDVIPNLGKLGTWDSVSHFDSVMVLDNSTGLYELNGSFPSQSKEVSLVFVQVLADFEQLPGNVSIFYYKSEKEDYELNSTSFNQKALESLLSLSETKKNATKDYESDFIDAYFNGNKNAVSSSQMVCALNAHSQLQAGQAFFWGNITLADVVTTQELKSARLFTLTPSRVSYPRGFLWDEGFHQMVNVWMNKESAKLSLQTWMNLQDERGWIGREQIRGVEARKYGPSGDFAYSLTNETNPPTFAFLLGFFINSDSAENLDLVLETWPKMLGYFNFFLDYQSTNSDSSLFRWTENANMDGEGNPYYGSGLDDYPRTGPDGKELPVFNLDLHSWVMMFAQYMEKTSQYIQRHQDKMVEGNETKRGMLGHIIDSAKNYTRVFQEVYSNLTNRLNENFFDDSTNIYREPLSSDSSNFTEHLGYVNLFPFLFNLGHCTKETKVRKAYFDYMRNESLLWSSYGIRSLSLDDPFFGVGSDYWRGNIWINFNYLVLRAVYLYYMNDEGAADFYNELRNNVIKTVCGSLDSTGYLWENFDPLTGEPQDAHPFSGWSSLIVLIIAEKYDF